MSEAIVPIYEYECAACGRFEALAPLVQFDQPQLCPECNESAPRSLLSAPALAMMGSAQRRAYATNERSANAPETSRRTGRHPTGCGCCKTVVPTAKKSFPGKRPWMIGH